MITEKQLKEAIAECQGTRNPNANTCLKLASYYTILDHVDKEELERIPQPQYSYAEPKYVSETEFGKLVENMSEYDVMVIMDELMSTLLVVNPRLYRSVIRKLEGSE